MKYPKFNLSKLTKKQLLEIVKVTNEVEGPADSTCDEPGISFAEAIFREQVDLENPVFVRKAGKGRGDDQ